MRRFEDVVINQNGTPVGGALVTVFFPGTTTKATLYSDDGLTVLANPVITNANLGPNPGVFSFFIASGKYDFQVSGGSISTYTQRNVQIDDIFEFKVTDTQPWQTQTLEFSNQVAGATPPLGNVNLYTKTSDKNLYFKDDTGREVGPLGAITPASNAAIKPLLPGDPIQFVSPNGIDTNDGLSWGSAKLTVYAALQALPGGAVGVAGSGTILLSGTVSYGGPVVGQGMWIMASSDPNFALPPAGWLKWNPFAGQSLTIDCGIPSLSGPHGHTSACGLRGGSLTLPASWFSGTGQIINLRNITFVDFATTYIRWGIGSNGNRTIGGASLGLSGINFGFGNCHLGNGPGIDIGSNAFWIWMKDMVCGGCTSQIFTITNPGASRVSNVTTITTANPHNILLNDFVTITNVPDDSFNGTYNVSAVLSTTQFTYNNFGPDVTTGTGQVVTAGAAAINIDPGPTGSGSGLIFLDNINLNNGGIRFVPGANGGGLYARNLSYEGDFVHPDMPVVLITKEIDPTIVRIENVEVSDPSVFTPGVRVDNPSSSPANQDSVIVSRIASPVVGRMLSLGGVQTIGQTPLRAGQYGFFGGQLIAGGIEVSRRNFPPVNVPASNLASTNPANWIFGTGAGTITSGILAPDGTLNAGRVTSSIGQSFPNFYTANNVALTVGDAWVFGVWARSVTGNGYSGQQAPVKFNLNNNGIGVGCTCANTQQAFSQLLNGLATSADGQWQWFTGICKIGSAPTLAGLQFTGIVDTTHSADFFTPTLMKFAAGTKSDNEIWEIARNFSSFPDSISTPGAVAMLRGQSFVMGTGAGFLYSQAGAPTADRITTWPDNSGTVAELNFPQTWTASQTFQSNIFSTGVTFASLGTPANGAFVFCSDCNIASPCTGGGTGAFAKRLNGNWVCN